MKYLLASPIVLSALLLAAHFLRGGQAALVAVCLALPLLLRVGRPWARWALSLALVLGALEWLRMGMVIAQQRMAMGEPWLRMAIILGSVALVSAVSGALVHHRHLSGRP